MTLVFQFLKSSAEKLRCSVNRFGSLNKFYQVFVFVGAEADEIFFVILSLPALFYIAACFSY